MERFKHFKKNLMIFFICFFGALAVLLICLAFLLKEQSLTSKHIEVGFAILMLLLALISCILIDKESGIYICPKCGKEFTTTGKEYLKGMHIGYSRKLVCPYCHEKNYCKMKKIEKEEKDE